MNKKGFTLMEAVASMIALGIVALSVQSLLLVTNNFFHKQKNSFASLENLVSINDMICSHFSEPIFVQHDPRSTFGFKSDTNTYRALALKSTETSIPAGYIPPEKASLSFPLDKLINSNGRFKWSLTLLSKFGQLGSSRPSQDGNAVDDCAGPVCARINDKTTNFNNLRDGSKRVPGSHNHLSQFYDVYSDTHTLVAFQVDLRGMEKASTMGNINKGTIFASRCGMKSDSSNPWKVESGRNERRLRTIMDSTNEVRKKNADQSVLEAADALFVLMNPHRPFYFPEKKNSFAKIQCCDVRSHSIFTDTDGNLDTVTGCKNLSESYPVTYAINIESMNVGEFSGKGKDGILKDGSLKGYFNNNAEDLKLLKKESDCKDTTTEEFDFTRNDCRDKARELYGKKLLDFFTYPVEVTSIYELPMGRVNRTGDQDSVWAQAFVADYVESVDSNIVKMNLFSVENKCYSFLPSHMCKRQDDTISPGEKKFTDYLKTKTYSCPFSYKNLRSSGSSIPLGVVLE